MLVVPNQKLMGTKTNSSPEMFLDACNQAWVRGEVQRGCNVPHFQGCNLSIFFDGPVENEPLAPLMRVVADSVDAVSLIANPPQEPATRRDTSCAESCSQTPPARFDCLRRRQTENLIRCDAAGWAFDLRQPFADGVRANFIGSGCPHQRKVQF